MNVIHIISSLGDGGAEGVLYRLITHGSSNVQHHVICLTGKAKYGPLLTEQGVSVVTLDMPPGNISLGGLKRLVSHLLKYDDAVVQTWMYHADLLGGLVCKLFTQLPVYWGIRSGTIPSNSRMTKLVAKLCALGSRYLPILTISCTHAGLKFHEQLGYKSPIAVIPNGYDMSSYSDQTERSTSVRVEQNIHDGCFVLGMVGRWDPCKDHNNLFSALQKFKKQTNVDFKLLLIGNGCTIENQDLEHKLKHFQLSNNINLLGLRTDIPEIMANIDVHVLSSSTEGFPNVIAEAMASGTPCVSTDVGDARHIIGGTGWLVPPKNSDQLAQAMIAALHKWQNNALWEKHQVESRQRIHQNFSIEHMVKTYEEHWAQALSLA